MLKDLFMAGVCIIAGSIAVALGILFVLMLTSCSSDKISFSKDKGHMEMIIDQEKKARDE